jgi:DNA repair protein RecN (Recombination protein N)
LSDTGALEIECNALRKEAKKEAEKLAALSEQLHQSRVQAATPLSEAITASIRSLELEYARFEVQVQSLLSDAAISGEDRFAASAYGPTGADKVSFLFSANGTQLEDVAKCASGGEMSRIMLSLKDMMARYAQMPTMIFDEIDSGVSGSVADRMGSMICSMGERMQVFAITHLPQVAAKGNAHYVVAKHFEECVSQADASCASAMSRRAVSTLSRLNQEERVQEVARMLSGSTLTPEAIENAKVLLGA